MTNSSRPGPHLVDMLRRLRARPVSSWGVGDRERVARAALQRLADLAADASGNVVVPDVGVAEAAASAGRVVPDVGLRALPDQLAVLVADAEYSGVPPAALNEVLAELAAALSV